MVFLTIKEYADIYRISIFTVRRWIKEGRIEAKRIGQKYIIPHTATTGDPIGRNLLENMLYDYSNDLKEEAMFIHHDDEIDYKIPLLEKITKRYVEQIQQLVDWKGVAK